ncbi:MAG: divalent-cation tolerance protein CutA [Candidatus Acidiferrum sp.]|jgi:periplasmic divalent cation tolerance protein
MKASKARKTASGRQTNTRVVLVTVSSIREGRRIANRVVKKRLAACVNILRSPVRSIYRWKGKIEVATEYFLVIKTTASGYAALEKEITQMHSYDVPEIVALPIAAGAPKYLAWLGASVE